MAKIPSEQDLLPSRSVPRPQQTPVDPSFLAEPYIRAAQIEGQAAQQRARSTIEGGAALYQAGSDLVDWKKEQDKLLLAGAAASYLEADLKARDEIAQSNDYTSYQKHWQKQTGSAIKKIQSGLPGHLHSRFRSLLAKDRVRGLYAVRKMARGENAEQEKAYLDQQHKSILAAATRTDITNNDRTNALLAFNARLAAAERMNLITPEDAVKRRYELAKDFGGAMIGEWFRKQPDVLGAANAMVTGKIDDEYIKGLYDTMNAKDRQALTSQLLTTYSRLTTIENNRRREEERIQKESDNTTLNAILFVDEMSEEDRHKALERLKRSPHMTPAKLTMAEDLLRNGSRAAGFDVAFDLAQAEAEIQAGMIRDLGSYTERAVENGWKISIETLRTRIMPKIKDYQDETFGEAVRWGLAEFGILTGKTIIEQVTAMTQKVPDKAAKFEAAMRLYKHKTPAGDFWAEAQRLVEQIRKAPDVSTQTDLFQRVQRYRNALKGKDPATISIERLNLIRALVQSGQVNALDAARSDFDPLSVIEKPKEPTGGR